MGRKFGWHSGKLTCKDLDVQQTITLGTLDFGAAELDSIIIKGRMATSTVAGAALSLPAGYTYGELMEMRVAVASWTGIAGSFKGYYFRAQADVGNASYGIRGMEIYGVCNVTTGTTGLNNLQSLYAEMLVKASATNKTITSGGAIEANISIENYTGTLTFTNNVYCVYAKAQTGTGIADYTKINGIKIAGRDDGTARVFGIALDISDPEATVCTWTKGINITTSCTTGIILATGTFTTAINLGGTLTTGITIGACTTAYTITGAVTTGYNIAGNATDAFKVTSGTITNAFDVAGGTITTGVLIAAATTTGISITGNSTDAIKIATGTFTDGIDLGGTLTIALNIGACTTAVAIAGTATTGVAISGATTTGINISGNSTDAIKIQTGTFTDAIEIAGTTTNGINIGACTTGITIPGATTTGISITGNATDAINILTGTFTDAIEIAGTTTNSINISAVGTTSSVGFLVVNGFLGKAIKVGTLSSTTPGSGAILDATTTRIVEVNADDNNAARAVGTQGRAIFGRTMIYADNACEDWGIHGLSKISAVIKSGNVSAGIVGAFETTGTCQVSTGSGNSFVAGVMGRVGTGGSVTLDAGTYAACVLAFGNNDNASAFTGTGYVGFLVTITDVGTAETFDAGLVIDDSSSVTGIDIGTCTTGIDITGTTTTGLNFTSTTSRGIDFTSSTIATSTDRSKSAISFGKRGSTAITLTLANTAAAQHWDPVQFNIAIAGVDPGASTTMNMIYQNIAHSTADMANLRLKGSDWTMDIQKNILDAYVYQGEIDFSTNAIAVGGEAAGLGITMSATSAVTGNVWGAVFAMSGSGLGTSAGVFISARSTAVLTHGLYIEPSSGTTITNGIYINNAGTVTNVMNFNTPTNSTNLLLTSGEGGCIGATRVTPNQTAVCDGSLVVQIGAKTLLIPLYNAVTIA